MEMWADKRPQTEISEDTTSPAQIAEALRSISDGKGYIAMRDLELARVPLDTRNHLEAAMHRLGPSSTEDGVPSPVLHIDRYLNECFGHV